MAVKEQWRKDMNAALGVMRAQQAAGDNAAAAAAFNNALNSAQTSSAVSSVQKQNPTSAALQGYSPDYSTPSSPTPSSPTTSPAFSSPTTYVPPPPPATPPSPWNTIPTYTTPKGIKQAQPDIVIDPEIDTSGDYIVERFFEELGGTELINLSRHDLIDGIDVVYNPIANLSSLRKRYNPNNIIALDVLSDNEFSKVSIDFLSRGPSEPYFDEDGNLVIEVDIIRPEENIEAEISLSGTINRIEL